MMIAQLPTKLYRAEQVRHGEKAVAKISHINMYELMERAGQAVFITLKKCFPAARSITVCCGGGNNGGDGYIVARLALQAGLDVQLLQLDVAKALTGDAARARNAWLAAGGKIEALSDTASFTSTDVIIDALLGTGLSGAVRTNIARYISMMNQASKPIIAVDVPSGLCADTGAMLGIAINATLTVTFIGIKQGLCTGQAGHHCGELLYADLDVESTFSAVVKPAAFRVEHNYVKQCLPVRHRSAHKGSYGRVLCIGGDLGMAGAIRLAAEACARAGAGLSAVITQPDNILSIVTARPEIMVQGWSEKAQESISRVEWADVVVLGPGLGTSNWSKALFHIVRTTEKKTVFDADGLNLLAQLPDYKKNRIITPHPGEAARLLNMAINEIERDRFATVRKLQQKYGGVAVLKGAGTLIFDGQQLWVCTAGNPGMATGGMGDVLSGIIGALLGQGLSLADAACVGVWVHSKSADLCAQKGERGMLASDLFPYIRQLINPR
ncbi:NAD(P)H-hydrate dehydratase [Photobacterium frigidiphilum]|uniref:NAD(P)H-hydrate dehydratase n=1 Tax=Photobacterium frigidiphilum TaxID=264736 RepID=UPI003D133214